MSAPGAATDHPLRQVAPGPPALPLQTLRQDHGRDYGTLFHGKRTDEAEILETLALLAEGSRITSLSRVKGFKEDTILAWLREAAQHAEAVADVLMKDDQISRAQIDGLWSYVGHKGAKKTTSKPTRRASSGARP